MNLNAGYFYISRMRMNDGRNIKAERIKKRKGLAFLQALHILVGRAGFEPATNGLKVRCSTS